MLQAKLHLGEMRVIFGECGRSLGKICRALTCTKIYNCRVALLLQIISFFLVSAKADSCGTTFFDAAFLPLFCNDPYEAVCGKRGIGFEGKKVPTVFGFHVIAANDAPNAGDQIRKSAAKSLGIVYGQGKPISSASQQKVSKKFLKDFNKWAESQVDYTNGYAEVFDEIKNDFLNSVQSFDLNGDTKKDFFAKVQKAKVITPYDYYLIKGDKIWDRCGGLLADDSLFYIDDMDSILICPGTIFYARSFFPLLPLDRAFKAYIETGLLHEFGHAFNNLKTHDKYTVTDSCFQNHYSFDSQKKEAEADYWASRALSHLMALDSAFMSKEELYNRYVSGGIFHFACLDDNDERSDHGSSKWRFKKIFEGNPQIRKIFGCGTVTDSNLNFCKIERR